MSEEILKEINDLEAKLAVARIKLNNFNNLSFEQKIAIVLHDNTCFSNHIDQCGWLYEINDNIHDFNGCAHERYLKRAKEIIARLKKLQDVRQDAKHFLEIVEAVIKKN